MSPKDYQPLYNYGFDEFEKHCDFFLRPQDEAISSRERSEIAARYFAEQYPDHSEARYKGIRFSLAVTYLQKHIGEFEDFAVEGQKLGLVARPLMYALWRYYAAIPDEHLGNEPETELIQQFADEETRDRET
jgi:hypothetical protein